MSEDFTPRNYQVELMKIGLENNTIIFLPTGSGKTFIALMILKQMSGSLLRSYGEGGKITIILVNTIALVDQHAKYIRDHTNLTVGQYTGDMNLDFWPKDKWYNEYNKYQVLIMTSQILVNLNLSSHIDLNKVNLLIFDECHRGVNDHSMRQLMKTFGSLSDPPRVIGLTATLLNGNCKPGKVLQEVIALETTYHSKVATVDGLSKVIGYSTNPRECFKVCQSYVSTSIETMVIAVLNRAISIVGEVKVESAPLILTDLKPLENDTGYKKLSNLITDLIVHIETMGTYGGVKSAIAHTIQMERLKKNCQDLNTLVLFNYLQTTFSYVKQLLENSMKKYSEQLKITKFSSDKILRLLEILKEYKTKSKEELCAIIFTKRRFTAKVIYHILDNLRHCDPDYDHIIPNYMVGYNNNPFNDTRENLFRNKKNKQVLESFANKEINVIVSSNVLEEGVDIPKCTLVIKYDKPEDYRSYIQSKGRARHKDSLYYMIVEGEDSEKFKAKYKDFQIVEESLNDYLIGKNAERPEPSDEDIEKMYTEDELPPYYVSGPGSAQVNMQCAIPLLCQYCNSLPSDIYTTYAPEWYVKTKKMVDDKTSHSVVIILPTICPILDPIEGEYMRSVKLAKRAAALKACILLHKAGELDDHLLPRKAEIVDEDVSFLFTHYPAVKEPNAGHSKNKRLHKNKITQYVQGQVQPDSTCFLHIIHLDPIFTCHTSDINNISIYDAYTSSLCFGIITPKPLPDLCKFPIYVSLGTIRVHLKVNEDMVSLDEKDVDDIRKFHVLVFDDLLKILQSFLIFDNSAEAETLLLVPVDRNKRKIDFHTVRQYNKIKSVLELTSEEKLCLDVTQDTYLRKIVSPWYRRDPATYIVTEVSLNKNAYTPFPNEDFDSFKQYFEEKHGQSILCPSLPLLLVKGITKRLNFIKPKGRESKRKRDKLYEEMTEYLLPELIVKQEFPSSLWIQANFLPTILYRISYMLQLEELRCTVAQDIGLDQKYIDVQPPLTLDEYLLDYQPFVEENSMTNIVPIIDEKDLNLPPTTLHINKDFASKILEAEYPWKDIDEPKDIERDLDVTIMDVEIYVNFVTHKVDNPAKFLMKNESPSRNTKLALTYPKHFIPQPIQLLQKQFSKDGPAICDLYRALTTAKANDIVNLERLETLGDSFLKLIASVYVTVRFPKYDEGRATNLKGRIVSNKNLYYLAKQKNLAGIMKYNELSPKDEWLPPSFSIPSEMFKRIDQGDLSVSSLFNLNIPVEEQISGKISQATLNEIMEESYAPEATEASSYNTMGPFLKCQYIGDKHVADVVESLLGVYFQSCGFLGGIKFIEWVGIIPQSENLESLLKQPSPNPILNINATSRDIDLHLPHWEAIQNILGYTFTNRAYLLQAMTHSSYTQQRITKSYEKLEFLGDAVLDFLITCHIYESCGNLTPGELTDLRSALVNNNTFASLVVRSGLHKFLLMINSKLQGHIDKFVEFLKAKDYKIDDEVLILLEEDELNLAEYVDVPKVLGDIFEAVAGAIYLDSGNDLRVVWDVFYKIMWKEIELFSQNVPKNVVRRLFEWQGTYPKFGNAVITSNNKTLIPLQFMLNGRAKIVHGCGTNKSMAKKAAAKLALRSLDM